MAVNPLYNSKAALLLKIRLSEAQSDQTNAVIDLVISKVRLGFFDALTNDRAIEIAGFASSDNPTTDNEILKSLAEVAEALWVTAILMELLPQMFIEGEAEARQAWNEEPLTRDAAALRKARQEILNQVKELLGGLMEPVDDNTGMNKSFSTGRKTPFILANNFIGKQIKI